MVRRRETVKLVGLKIVQQDESSCRNVQQIDLTMLLRTPMTMLICMIMMTNPFNQSPKWSDTTTSVSKLIVRMAEYGSMVGKLVEQQ